MAEIGPIIRTYLLTDTAFKTACGSRVYPGPAPQAPTKPYVCYYVVDTVRARHLTGAAGSEATRIQFDCVAATAAAAAALARLALAKLEAHTGGALSGTAVQELDTSGYLRETSEELGDGSGEWEYTASFDCRVWWNN